ncbi:MAG: YhcN/YlaJ family sporulation lipoprotein [Bacillota bacterium]
MKRTSLFVLLLVLVVSMALLVSACAPAKRPLEDRDTAPQRNDITRNGVPENNLPGDNRPGNDITTDRLRNAQAVADRISNACDDVPGVEDATVVISGDTCYVGLDVEGNLENEETERVERAALNKALAADPSVRRCVVTSDADTVSRLQKIYQGVRRGTPISTFGDELEEIGRRITPKTRE